MNVFFFVLFVIVVVVAAAVVAATEDVVNIAIIVSFSRATIAVPNSKCSCSFPIKIPFFLAKCPNKNPVFP